MKRAVGWLLVGAAGIAGSYWLLRYLRPRHSTLAFDGAVAVIPNANSPIGQALAMALAQRGARLALAATDSDTLDRLRQAVDPYASDVLTIAADSFTAPGPETLIDSVLAHYQRIDLLFVELDEAAGGPFDALDEAAITDATMHLSGLLALTRRALSSMRTRASGVIVYVAPIAGRVAMPGLGAAGATAHGLIGFADGLRRELFGTGVQVITALVGWTRNGRAASLRLERRARLPLLDPTEVAETLLTGLLNGQREIVIGSALPRALVVLERYAPFLTTLYWRVFNSPLWLAAAHTQEQEPIQ